MSTERKIVQIAAVPSNDEHCLTLFALADDGTIWSVVPNNTRWIQVNFDPLPQPNS